MDESLSEIQQSLKDGHPKFEEKDFLMYQRTAKREGRGAHGVDETVGPPKEMQSSSPQNGSQNSDGRDTWENARTREAILFWK